MHYVQELIMIISDVQTAFFSLDSVLVLIEKNFWHFLTYCYEPKISFKIFSNNKKIIKGYKLTKEDLAMRPE